MERNEIRRAAATVALVVLAWHLPASPAGAQERLTREALASADYLRGRLAFQQRCSACHILAEDALHLARPNLWGVIGRTAGSREEFTYSEALKNADFAWTPDRVDDEQEFVFDAYFNKDGSVSSSMHGIDGFWHIDDRDFFCYALKGLPVDPDYFVQCFPVAAMAIPRFSEQLWQSPAYGGAMLYGGILPGRPTDDAGESAPE